MIQIGGKILINPNKTNTTHGRNPAILHWRTKPDYKKDEK